MLSQEVTTEDEFTVKADGQRLDVVTQPCHFGGVRYYFLCPQCGRKCYKLYSLIRVSYIDGDEPINSLLKCAKCLNYHRLTLNRTKSDPNYYYEQAYKEARKLDPSIQRPTYMECLRFPWKPKRMRWRTYEKHRTRFNRYMSKGDRLMGVNLNKILEMVENKKTHQIDAGNHLLTFDLTGYILNLPVMFWSCNWSCFV